MDLIELAKIEETLRCDRMTYIGARRRVYRPAMKLSQTEDWREKSNGLLKGSCEQCGMTNVPMVLQQTQYPSPYRRLEQMVYKEFLEEQIAAGSYSDSDGCLLGLSKEWEFRVSVKENINAHFMV